MQLVLLDTDVLSEVVKGKRPGAVETAERYLEEHFRLTFSAITLYEIERGLTAKRSAKLMARFDVMLRSSDVLPLTIDVLRRAARLWATAARQGRARNDADLLIAATALEHELPLVTGNRSHFEWIEELKLETWW